MVKILINKFLELSLGVKVCIILILLAILPSFSIYSSIMNTYEEDMIQVASENIHSVVKSNNHLIDSMLQRVEEVSYLFVNNKECYDIFSDMNHFTTSDFLKADRIVTDILGKQFTANDSIYTKYLYTSEWIFGTSSVPMKANINEIQNFQLDRIAVENGGQAHWITGYDYGEWFQKEYLSEREDYVYQYPLTMVRQMNFQYSLNGKLYTMDIERERPILVVHIVEDTISDLYQDSIPYNGSLYGVVNENGIIISSDNETYPINMAISQGIFKLKDKSGYDTYSIDGKEYLLFYDPIYDRGWFSYCLVPLSEVIQATKEQITYSQLWFTIMLLILSVIIAALLSRTISKPIEELTRSAHRVATGDFSADTPEPKGKDFKMLTQTFNNMEKEITRLIHENYQISLQEKDTQIMALTMQINPHFLYNTLNTINMVAIREGDYETSDLIVSLSEMLQYSFRNTNDLIPLSDEIYWLQNYINIMEQRFCGIFTTKFEVNTELYVEKVPKFFLQPFVENAILHGFHGMKSGGQIVISATLVEDNLQFIVSDNGRGMALVDKHQMKVENIGEGIGITNVIKRLDLLFGENYRLDIESEIDQGTTITLIIPRLR